MPNIRTASSGATGATRCNRKASARHPISGHRPRRVELGLRSGLLTKFWRKLGESDRSRPKRDCGSLNQISQPTEFKALRKPPNALSRQSSVSLAAFERSGMVVRLISVVFGFDLGTAAVVTFFDLGSSRWGLIILGASEEPIPVASDGEMRSSTRAGCAGVSLFA